MADDYKLVKFLPTDSYWPTWLSWRPTSNSMLHSAESKILSYIKNKIDLFYVPIRDGKAYLRTLKASKTQTSTDTEYEKKAPLVMMHGMGAGIGLWCKNIDPLSEHRRLYAMDLLGFGSSSRLTFPSSVEHVEDQFVESIEDWRKKVDLDQFILLGHSMGGYLAYAYALKYPNKVKHLILADPWGFSRIDEEKIKNFKLSWWKRNIFNILKSLDPLAGLRFSGPFGPYLIRRLRPDLGYYFNQDQQDVTSASEEIEDNLGVYDYIYHCNAQSPSTGEKAFKILSQEMGWARCPMVERMQHLDKSVPVTFLYGEQSWMDLHSGIEFHRERSSSYVDVQVIPNCGHHIYAEGAGCFNDKVNSVCNKVDCSLDRGPNPMPDIDMLQQNTQTTSRHRRPPPEPHKTSRSLSSPGEDANH